MQSNALVRLMKGPVGSGKSVTCIMELFRRCAEMPKCKDGMRRSRWAVIRNTSQQLRDTTLKTWFNWFPDGIAGQWKVSDKVFYINVGDIRAEILFLPLDTPDDQRKLLSLELTGVFINEAREVHPELVIAARSRLTRYPSKSMLADDPRTGKPPEYWSGLIMDTNPPSEDSWLYEQFEVLKPNGWELFSQPSGLSPLAENRDNLGLTYYEDMMEGATEDFIRVHVHGEYGRSLVGKPVYEKSFVREYHVAPTVLRHIEYDQYPIIIGMDFGRTPAAVMLQRDARGRVLVLDSIYVENIGLQGFLREYVKPLLSRKFPANKYIVCGDPAGWARSQLSEQNVEDVFKEEGLRSMRAPTNDPTKRIASVEKLLASQINGAAAILFSSPETSDGMKFLVQGMYGGYKYRRKKDGSYETEPMKDEFSHCFVHGTLVSTPSGPAAINDLFLDALVDTPLGPRKVTNTMSRTVFELVELTLDTGEKIVSSSDHPYYTDKGLVPACFLQYNDVLLQQGENRWLDQQKTPFWSLTGRSFISSRAGISNSSTSMVEPICTGMSGSSTTGRYQTSTMSTTRMATRQTTSSAIWSFLQRASIRVSTAMSFLRGTLKRCVDESSLLLQKLLSGMQAQRGLSGTGSMASKRGRVGSWSNGSAPIAESTSRGSSGPLNVGFAPTRANPPLGELPESTMSPDHAASVAALSWLINTQRLKPAPKIVGVKLCPVPNGVLVYDITVDEVHAFYAGGVLVANCSDALQYGCLGIDSGAMAAAMGAKKRPVRVMSSAGWT
jgi:hypothetical protein